MNIELKKYLKNLDAILISSHANIVYLTGNSGFSEIEREAFLLIAKRKNYLVTDKRYSGSVRGKIKDFDVIDKGALHFINKDAEILFRKMKIKTVGFESSNLTVGEYSKFRKFVKLKPLDLKNIRIIKHEDEIKNIKLACKIGDKAFNFIIHQIKLGVTEQEISDKIEHFIKKHSAKVSFAPIVAFGNNSSVPHHLTGPTKLKINQGVLLDFGVKINNYCSDMSRTVFFGKADEKFKRMHKVVLEAQGKAIQYINNQLSMVNGQLLAKDIDKAARDYIKEQGFPNIIHSVGHGIGIEVHESPHLSPHSYDKIEQGMIFSVEPGIYKPSFGGVRIEDLVLVTKNGAELLSKAKREIIEI